MTDRRLIGLLGLLLLATLMGGLFIGSAPLGPGEIAAGITGTASDERLALIIHEIRLPRLIVGAAVGFSLGLSGAALQGLLRNPLADPGVIGISAAAGLGAVIALYYGFAALSPFVVPGLAMASAAAATALLYLLARRDTSVLTLILVGIGINALAGALTSLAMNLSPNPFSLSDMVLWLLGSLANRSATDIWLAGPFMLIGWLLLLMSAPGLRLLTLGEETAATLGLDRFRLRSLVVIGAALSVGAGVAVSGAIGFVGLIVPHMIRPFVGHDPARLLIPSGIAGAILILIADATVRLAPTDQELRLGVLTALIGAPFFLFLVLKNRRRLA